MKMCILRSCWFSFFLLSGTGALGVNSAPWDAQVLAIVTDSSAFGGCIALVSPAPSAQAGVNCAGDYVTFSCTGDFNSKSAGASKLSAAQLAFVTQGTVRLVVQDQFTHNGYCFARRIDNRQAAP